MAHLNYKKIPYTSTMHCFQRDILYTDVCHWLSEVSLILHFSMTTCAVLGRLVIGPSWAFRSRPGWSGPNLAALLPDFVWRVCQKILILLILCWFGGKLIKNKKSWSRITRTYLFGQNCQFYRIRSVLHRNQWGISNTRHCAQLANAKSKYSKILNLRFLRGYLLVDDIKS